MKNLYFSIFAKLTPLIFILIFVQVAYSSANWTVYGNAGFKASIQTKDYFSSPNSLFANSSQFSYLMNNISMHPNEILTYWTYTTSLGDVFFLVNSSGAGQMARIDARPPAFFSTFPSGFAQTQSWSSWSGPSSGPTETPNTWYKVDIAVNNSTATLYVNKNNTPLQVLGAPVSKMNMSYKGGYVGLVGDAAGSTQVTYWNNIILRKYPPNGVMPSVTVGTSSSSCGNSTYKIAYCAQLNITNLQKSQMLPGTQVNLTLNATEYKAVESGNLQNVFFYNASSGSIIPSWLEGNFSDANQQSGLNESNSIVYWIKIPYLIPSGSSTTNIYIGFANIGSNLLNSTGPTGEAPQLSPSYGEYDNGNNIFNYYYANPELPNPNLPPMESKFIGKQIDNISYCTINNYTENLDIYYPNTTRKGPFPVVMYMHGGGFVFGTKRAVLNNIALMSSQLLENNYTLVSINYTDGNGTASTFWPVQIEDAKCAIRFLRANAAKYNIDPNKIVATGDSAGGGLAALLAVANKSAGWDVGQYLNYSSRANAVIDLFGPQIINKSYIALPIYNASSSLAFGNNIALGYNASAIIYVRGNEPPILLMQGLNDTLLSPQQATLFYNQLELYNNSNAELILVSNAQHEFAPVSLGPQNPTSAQRAQLAINFLNRYFNLNSTIGVKLQVSRSIVDSGQTIVLSANVVGGTKPLSYMWVGPGTYSCHSSTCEIAAPFVQNQTYETYNVTVIDSVGHSASSTHTVVVFPPISIQTAFNISKTGFGNEIKIAANVSGGYPGFSLLHNVYNVTYCTINGFSENMTIYYPNNATAAPLPVAVYFHSAVTSNSKAEILLNRAGTKSPLTSSFVNSTFAYLISKGYAVAAVNYTDANVSQGKGWPLQIEESECAIRFLRANAVKYHLDPNKIIAWGDSGGGLISLLLGMTNSSTGWETGQFLNYSSRPDAIIDMFGPSVINSTYIAGFIWGSVVKNIFGNNTSLEYNASPINYVRRNEPPIMIIQGFNDTIAYPEASIMLYNKLQEFNNTDSELIMVSNAEHEMLHVGTLPENPSTPQLMQLMSNFLNEYLYNTTAIPSKNIYGYNWSGPGISSCSMNTCTINISNEQNQYVQYVLNVTDSSGSFAKLFISANATNVILSKPHTLTLQCNPQSACASNGDALCADVNGKIVCAGGSNGGFVQVNYSENASLQFLCAESSGEYNVPVLSGLYGSKGTAPCFYGNLNVKLPASGAFEIANFALHPQTANYSSNCTLGNANLTVTQDVALGNLFDQYGDSNVGGNWSGGDGAYSVLLPNGTDVWIFGDTGTGRVINGTRTPWQFIHNSFVLEQSGKLVATLYNRSNGGQGMISPSQPNSYFWMGAPNLDGNILQVIAPQEFTNGSTSGQAIASFFSQNLTVKNITPANLVANTSMSWALKDRNYTYIYGVQHAYVFVERVSGTNLLSPMQYFNGSSWSTNPSNLAVIGPFLGSSASVIKFRNRYLLFGLFPYLSNKIYMYSSCSPSGPFIDGKVIYSTPEQNEYPNSYGIFTYEPLVHPELSSGNSIVLSYSVNGGGNNASVYRPRFIFLNFSFPPNSTPKNMTLPLKVNIYPIHSSIYSSQIQTLTASALGGVGPYEYQWYNVTANYANPSDPIIKIPGSDSNTITIPGSNVGSSGVTNLYSVEATDSSGVHAYSTYAILSVYPELKINTASVNQQSLSNFSLELTTDVSGGIPPYTYDYNVFNGSQGNKIIYNVSYANVDTTSNTINIILPRTNEEYHANIIVTDSGSKHSYFNVSFQTNLPTTYVSTTTVFPVPLPFHWPIIYPIYPIKRPGDQIGILRNIIIWWLFHRRF